MFQRFVEVRPNVSQGISQAKLEASPHHRQVQQSVGDRCGAQRIAVNPDYNVCNVLLERFDDGGCPVLGAWGAREQVDDLPSDLALHSVVQAVRTQSATPQWRCHHPLRAHQSENKNGEKNGQARNNNPSKRGGTGLRLTPTPQQRSAPATARR